MSPGTMTWAPWSSLAGWMVHVVPEAVTSAPNRSSMISEWFLET